MRVTLGLDYRGVLAEPRPEAALAGTFPGVTAPPAATPTTAVTVPPTTGEPNAPTITSAIFGQPPDGVTCN